LDRFENKETEKYIKKLRKLSQKKTDSMGFVDTSKPYYKETVKISKTAELASLPTAKTPLSLLESFYENRKSSVDSRLILNIGRRWINS
jgi:hypothetical protein